MSPTAKGGAGGFTFRTCGFTVLGDDALLLALCEQTRISLHRSDDRGRS